MTELFFRPGDVAEFSEKKMKKVNLYESGRMFCDVYCLLPGQSQKAHAHAENDKFYYGLTGECEVQIGEARRTIGAGDLAVAPAGVEHGVTNNGAEKATLLVVMAPHPAFRVV